MMTQSVLYFLQTEGNKIIRLDLQDFSQTVIMGPVPGMLDGIVADTENRVIYWTNMGDAPFTKKDGAVGRCGLRGENPQLLIPPGIFMTGKQLFLHHSRQELYWCDREGGAVMRCTTKGENIQTIVSRRSAGSTVADIADQCVGIAVDTLNNDLYWTQKGASKGGQGRIFRLSLDKFSDGNEMNEADMSVLLSGLPEPIDLSLDLQNGRLYWTDRGAPPDGNSLNVADFNESGLHNHRVIARGFREAIGLAMNTDDDLAYVADLSGCIYKVNLSDGRKKVIYQQGAITGIALARE